MFINSNTLIVFYKKANNYEYRQLDKLIGSDYYYGLRIFIVIFLYKKYSDPLQTYWCNLFHKQQCK